MTTGPHRFPALVLLAVTMLAQCTTAALQLGLPALAPQLIEEFGWSTGQLALLLAATPTGIVISVFGAGALADRLGSRVVLTVGMAIAATSLVAAAWLLTRDAMHAQYGFAAFAALVLVAGAGCAPAHSAGARALIRRFPPERHGVVLGVRHTAIPLGGALGALVLPPVAQANDLAAAMLVLAGACAAAVIASAVVLPAERAGLAAARLASPSVAVQTIRTPALLLLGGGGASLVLLQLGMTSFLVLALTRDHGMGATDAARVLAATQLLAAVGRIVLGVVSDRTGARIGLMLPCAVVASCCLAIVPTVGGAAAVLLLAAATAVSGAWNGVAYAAAASLAPGGRDGSALGLQTTMFAAAGLAAPLLAGALVHAAGWTNGLALLAVPGTIACAVLWRARIAALHRAVT